jgi:acyl-CoA synthetase (AMP-forming)/AMP-acid ligase II
MIVFSENEVRANQALLKSAWSNKETFVLLPDKISVTMEWLEQCFETLPEKYRAGCFILLTSGTTGLPKLVVGSKERSEALAAVLHSRQDSEAVRQTISVLPLAYSYSFVNQWLWSHVHSREFVLTQGFVEPVSLLKTLESARETMVCMVGVQVPLLLSQAKARIFPGVARVHFAGGRFPQEKMEDLSRVFPNAIIYNNYGCAEAMPRLTVRKAAESSNGANVGRPLAGIEITINEDHAIHFRSPYGAVGVVEAQVFRRIDPKEWIPSGDLGNIEEDGSLKLIGRTSEVFKRHGEKVSLASLSSTVAAIWPGQLAFYREQDSSGEQGCVLVLTPLAKMENIRPVLMALRHHHPRSHWPIRIETLEELPMLPNGKPDIQQIALATQKVEIWKQHI